MSRLVNETFIQQNIHIQSNSTEICSSGVSLVEGCGPSQSGLVYETVKAAGVHDIVIVLADRDSRQLHGSYVSYTAGGVPYAVVKRENRQGHCTAAQHHSESA